MKKITITFYSPKELWRMFWNRFFWPRRKVCAEWMDYGQCLVEHAIISDVICKTEELGISIGFDEAVKLELAIKPKIAEAFDEIKELISKPMQIMKTYYLQNVAGMFLNGRLKAPESGLQTERSFLVFQNVSRKQHKVTSTKTMLY